MCSSNLANRKHCCVDEKLWSYTRSEAFFNGRSPTKLLNAVLNRNWQLVRSSAARSVQARLRPPKVGTQRYHQPKPQLLLSAQHWGYQRGCIFVTHDTQAVACENLGRWRCVTDRRSYGDAGLRGSVSSKMCTAYSMMHDRPKHFPLFTPINTTNLAS